MKITSIDDIHADAGWRTLSFLKITTDSGLIGWSEFGEGRSSPGLTGVIKKIAQQLIGQDPREVGKISAKLYAHTRTTAGGMISQANAAIENSLLDIKAKALGVPVYELFGGAVRHRMPVYWSHCGTLRVRHPALFGASPLRNLDDVTALGEEVKAKRYPALKTNILTFADGVASNYQGGFGMSEGHPEINLDDRMLDQIVALMAAFQKGAGADVKLSIDLNCNFKPEGVRQIAKALEPFRLLWLEFDLHDPRSLAAIRQSTTTKIGSLETVYGRRDLKPYLDETGVDVVIIDPQWNGMIEATRMASFVDTYEINVAVHNYHGHLSTMIGAHFAAVIPNFRIAEIVVDEAPWVASFFTHPLTIANGEITVPSRPGWGTDINEDAIRAGAAKR
ncbi:MAG TPA: mandelate racemase/muconate lactonizing enzyme family protein [Xanthobacteraceae bacterium]|jgi:L-alanine-DL-glutamate epimerase-like enolase superfamily enzyme|nr:mandelate racemase/muconate lactonizing enzyme family protein [Xanthobacteraceae bacterium]